MTLKMGLGAAELEFFSFLSKFITKPVTLNQDVADVCVVCGSLLMQRQLQPGQGSRTVKVFRSTHNVTLILFAKQLPTAANEPLVSAQAERGREPEAPPVSRSPPLPVQFAAESCAEPGVRVECTRGAPQEQTRHVVP